MPNPGTANNPTGINDFSGPMGETGPAYGAVEREQVLTRAAPVGSPSPDSIPKRAQRRAARGQGGSGAPPGPISAPHAPTADAVAQQAQFWQSILYDPESSPLARQYAQRALAGG